MIKKSFLIIMVFMMLIGLIACQDKPSNEVELPNLTGMNRSQVLETLGSLGLQVTFADIINNQMTEGVFHSYGESLTPGTKVQKGTMIVVNFVKHEVINGVKLPDLEGKTEQEIFDVLIELDIDFSFEYISTNAITEGLFAGYANNYRVDMVVPFWTKIVINIAIPIVVEPVLSNGLMITKYIEGRDDNRAIEIMNRSNEDIDLSHYRIAIYENGSETPTIIIPMQGTLNPGDILVFTHTNSSTELKDKADIIDANLRFDGNDAVAITYKNGTIVDIIGNIGWGFFYLRNETFVRRSHIVTNSTTYNVRDWDIYASDYYPFLGTHPVQFPDLRTITFNPNQILIPISVPTGMVRVSYDGFCSNYFRGANDGDTSEFCSLDATVDHFIGNNRVRFVGINTPEMRPTEEPYAAAARDYLRSILENADEIFIMHDPASGLTETHGRFLGLIWADGLLVNLEMVRMGFSAAMYQDDLQRLIFNGVTLNRLFERAEEEARFYRRNIWSNT